MKRGRKPDLKILTPGLASYPLSELSSRQKTETNGNLNIFYITLWNITLDTRLENNKQRQMAPQKLKRQINVALNAAL